MSSTLAQATPKTCSLKWVPVTGATGYRVVYGSLDIDVQNVTQIQLFMVGLDQPGVTYTVAVKAYNSAGEGNASDPITVTIDSPTPPPVVLLPGKVTGLQVICP